MVPAHFHDVTVDKIWCNKAGPHLKSLFHVFSAEKLVLKS